MVGLFIYSVLFSLVTSATLKTTVYIPYKDGYVYEDLGHRFIISDTHGGCYFWPMTKEEARDGLTPSALRAAEAIFFQALEKGVNLYPLSRHNINHLAAHVVSACLRKKKYLVDRDGNGFTDLSKVKLQGSLPVNMTVILGRTALVG
ncbi:uncharacterized protein LOC121384971 [Gigantopelta aegis]|uniref:uncharacterized protein LOC121384971 n=1 Tax=Gigantopelta aegis TaxID=1735272 RepID=UPI001B88CA08|nr:uncharacterized protein LOC121384971 [Gigantopelta aegis]